MAALRDQAWFEESRQRIIENRERLAQQLDSLGFEVLPSRANFLFARHPDHGGKALLRGLRERGIVVRHFDKPRISEFLRITVGSEEECEAVVSALAALTG